AGCLWPSGSEPSPSTTPRGTRSPRSRSTPTARARTKASTRLATRRRPRKAKSSPRSSSTRWSTRSVPRALSGWWACTSPRTRAARAGGAKQGEPLAAMGKLVEKGQRMGTGQANVKAYNRQLRDLIIAGRAKPSFVVSQRIPLQRAPEAYEKFDKREEGWTKVLLKPQQES